ncbi:MAG: radical SAM protein [Candidatus Woesearchaeota archaeon]
MKVLLIKPKTLLEASIVSEAESIVSPLGLLYMGVVLKKEHHKIKFIDLDLEEKPIEDIVHSFKPDWIGITSTTPSFPYAIDYARRIKKITNTPIVIGGVHATGVDSKLLDKYPEIDYIVRGEGKWAMRGFVAGKNPELIDGVCFRKNNTVINKEITFINDLNTLPIPDRSLAKEYEYRDSPIYRRKNKHSTMLFSRGCMYKCIFCDYQTRGKPRFRNAENIIKEIKQEYAKSITDFRIMDEFFTMNKTLVKKVCNQIIKDGMKISWNCQTRADVLDEDIIILMKKSGCWCVQIGFETGSPAFMERINKRLNLEKVKETCKLLKKHKIFTVVFFIIGSPFETKKDINMTLKFARTLDTELVTFSMVTPFPATDLWAESKLDDFDKPTLKRRGIFSNKGYFLKNINMEKPLSKAIRTYCFRISAGIQTFLKEACFQ